MAPLLVRMEEVAGVVWVDIAAVARETTREPLAAPPLRSLDLADSTPESRKLSGLFREHGFKLVGPVTAHRWLQRTALAPGHVQGCFRAQAERT